ncbi:MAG: hypothetical protein QOI95_317 [Acidimicrobiaceae bacterium]|jgi:glycosyltransferase involved in cell wall biosynthesis
MLRAFPDAPLYTSLYDPDTTFPEFRDADVRPLWTNRIAALRKDHRKGLLLYPAAFSNLNVDADVTICSSSGFAHGARTTGRKVVYCYTPARWLYDEATTYLANASTLVKAGLKTAAPALRRWDRHAAGTADRFLTSSTAVARRIRDVYGINAEILPAPVPDLTQGHATPIADLAPGFVLCVGRLLPYKNVDVIMDAFGQLPGERLVVVGEGPEHERLEHLARSNTTLLGRVDDDELRWLYANSAGLVASSYEDYGLTPLEANAFGKPAVVLRGGGFVDTVLDGETGVFFDTATAPAIVIAIRYLLAARWDSVTLRAHASTYTGAEFETSLQALVRGQRSAVAA